MHIILLCGGPGRRLWPVSNGTRAKQYLKLLPGPDGVAESMVQRMARQIRENLPDQPVTAVAPAAQLDALRAQLGPQVPIIIEQERRGTCPAIALAVATLMEQKRLRDDEPVVVIPCDTYTDAGYFRVISRMANGSMLCFQSTVTPGLAFVALDPFVLRHDYTPVLQKAELNLFGVEDVQELAFYVLCAVKNPASASTVNMRCPVVIHPDKREARQIIMEMDAYEMRHPLAEFGPREEAASC